MTRRELSTYIPLGGELCHFVRDRTVEIQEREADMNQDEGLIQANGLS